MKLSLGAGIFQSALSMAPKAPSVYFRKCLCEGIPLCPWCLSPEVQQGLWCNCTRHLPVSLQPQKGLPKRTVLGRGQRYWWATKGTGADRLVKTGEARSQSFIEVSLSAYAFYPTICVTTMHNTNMVTKATRTNLKCDRPNTLARHLHIYTVNFGSG